MKQDTYRYKSSEIPILADRILGSYKRDKSYFEQYSSKFNHEFLARFEEEVNFLIHYSNSQELKDVIIKSNEKIESLLANFSLMVNIMETFLRRNYPVTGIQVQNFNMKDVKESLNKGCIWEIQRNCKKLINQLEINLEEFIDKGFISVLISDVHILVRRLNDMEVELADLTHSQDMISDEYRYINSQLNDLLETIIESTPAVFGDNDAAKLEEYSVEKLLMQSQYRRNEVQ